MSYSYLDKFRNQKVNYEEKLNIFTRLNEDELCTTTSKLLSEGKLLVGFRQNGIRITH